MRWRLIQDAPADGYRNMAVDEALLESCAGGGEGFPCLRFYAFRPPCLSLGFSQEAAGAVDLEACRRLGIDVVRRPTGGRAVLHDRELTYAVIARYGDGAFGTGVLQAYRAVSEALIAGFARLGAEASVSEEAAGSGSPRTGAICFAEPSRHEIAAAGFKIAGSAQARRRGAFLQHGSLPIEVDAAALAAATGAARDGRSLPPILGLAQVLGRRVAAEDLAAAIRAGFESALGARFDPAGLSEAESLAAEGLRARRYLATAWTFRSPVV